MVEQYFIGYTTFCLSIHQLMDICVFLLLCFFDHIAWGILVPWPGIKPAYPAVEVWSHLNHWTAREVPYIFIYFQYILSRIVELNSNYV